MEYCQKAFMGRENTQIVNITIRQQGLVIKSYSKKELGAVDLSHWQPNH